MSKSPAKKTPPSRSKSAAGKAPAKAVVKRGPVKPAARKAAAKPVARPKAAAKPAKKVAPKPVPKAASKVAQKPSARPSAKSTAKPSRPSAPAKAAKPAPRAAAPKPSAAPKAPAAKASAQPALRKTPVAAPRPLPKTTEKVLAPLASASASSNTRFTERFAPPRPPLRTLPEPIEPVRPAYKIDPKLINAWRSKAGRDLTEDELLAMPDGEYMNEKQLEFFRLRLQTLKDDLLSNAGETTEHLREDTTIVPDPADRATIEEEHALELRTRDRERKLLKKISQSLARIEAGDYGYCDETGEPIGLGRLLARPTANLSLEAQQRRELKQKMFGD